MNIPPSQWIFPRAVVESNHMNCVSQNRDLSRSIGADIAAARTLEASGIEVSDLDYVDLYSCFPVAVQCFADALQLKPGQELTFTGGMPFAGGPLNNYVLQSSCRLVELLRAKGKSHGLVSAVSGMLTKQGFAILSSDPPATGFVYDDVSDEVAARNPPLEVIESYNGEASIASYTVLYQAGAPWRLVAVCDTPGEQRVVAFSEDREAMERAMAEELCAHPVSIDGQQLTLQ